MDHPAKILLDVALSSNRDSWATVVRDHFMSRLFLEVVPMLSDVFTPGEIQVARSSQHAREGLLDRYRLRWVKPILRGFDQDALANATFSLWPYLDYQPDIARFPDELLEVDWGAETWTFYKIWAVVKAFGRWPFLLLNCGELPRLLSHCPCCGAPSADIIHLLSDCPATWSLYAEWAVSAGYAVDSGARLPWSVLRLDLFANRVAFLYPDCKEGQGRIIFVGKAISLAASCFSSSKLEADIDVLLHSARCSAPLWVEG